MADAGEDPTLFTAHSLPSDRRLWASVTNAYLGTRVYHDTLHVSGIYNGALGDTHRAVLPSPLNIQLEAPEGTGEQLTTTFVLDTNTGSFLHTLEGPSFRASQRIYAHRTLPHVLACSVSLARLGPGGQPITVMLRSAFSPESPDLALHLGPDFRGARYLYGHTLTPEHPGAPRQEVHMLWTPAPPALTLGEGQQHGTWEFLAVVGGSQAEAQACLAEALQLQASGTLYAVHAQAWARLWDSCGLDVVGPLPLRQALRGALYYLLSALPEPGAPGQACHGLSPGGLSNGSREECYWGHVFWDQDLWMFPNVLLFQPEAARALLQYRIQTLGGALLNAQNLGYEGAKFAWESAVSGLEVCPEDIYAAQEVHVNGAVALAFQLYQHSTQDLQLFREAGGWDVVSAVAEFWCSRVEWNPTEEKYHLSGVMPPDEYHSAVTNSVYTNVLAQSSLRFAAALAQDLGQPVPRRWLEVADKIKVPFDPTRNFHPEFDGYELGEEVKQADVVLLGYPVPFPVSPQVRRNNLEVYEAVTSPRGPAMTWGMFAVGWMELKEPRRAWDLLQRSFANITEPFKVWTENADGSGAVNFLTGMGGFLQAALFGFTGFRITGAGLTFDPTCLAEVSGVRVSGVSYLGNKLDFSFSEDSVTVEVRARAGPRAPLLEVELWPSQDRLPLPPGHKVSFPCCAAGYKVRSRKTRWQQALLQETPGEVVADTGAQRSPSGTPGPSGPTESLTGPEVLPLPQRCWGLQGHLWGASWAGPPAGCTRASWTQSQPTVRHLPPLPPSTWQPPSWAPGNVWVLWPACKTLLIPHGRGASPWPPAPAGPARSLGLTPAPAVTPGRGGEHGHPAAEAEAEAGCGPCGDSPCCISRTRPPQPRQRTLRPTDGTEGRVARAQAPSGCRGGPASSALDAGPPHALPQLSRVWGKTPYLLSNRLGGLSPVRMGSKLWPWAHPSRAGCPLGGAAQLKSGPGQALSAVRSAGARWGTRSLRAWCSWLGPDIGPPTLLPVATCVLAVGGSQLSKKQTPSR